MSDIDILRRIAERGLKQAQATHGDVDCWQHMLDEIVRFSTDAELAALRRQAEAAKAYREALEWIATSGRAIEENRT